MKRLLLAAIAALAALVAIAQNPAPSPPVPAASPAPAAASPSPASPALPASATNPKEAAAVVPLPGQPAGPTLEKNIPLIPENMPAQAEASPHHGRVRVGSTPRPSTFEAEKDIRIRIKLREAQTRAQNDPDIGAAWHAAQTAPNDPRRRELLAAYYNHLYDRTIKIDPSLTDHINARRTYEIDRLKYFRLGEDDSSIQAEDLYSAPVEVPNPNPPGPEGQNPPGEGSSE
ncbi:MAG: hypothetical protein ABSE62_14370 [Chthoniobacteraceae bacterium]|jgi:hypothetical protein